MNDPSHSPDPGFIARGGLWVLLQVPVMLGALLVPWWYRGATPAWDRPWVWFGAALTAFGMLAALTALFHLGKSLTPYPRPHSRAELRTHGVYRWSRHPIYSGLLTASLGWAITWTSLAGLMFALLVFVFFDQKARREERWLYERYPDYGAYAARVKRFWPGIY